MAPSISELPAQATLSEHKKFNGLTAGQLEPLFDQIAPFEDFPEFATGPTVWDAADYRHSPEKWVHRWTDEEIAEIERATDGFRAAGHGITDIKKELFPLPNVGPWLETVKDDIQNGKGFILLKGFPVQRWGLDKSAVAYMGIGTYLGNFVSQNSRGHVLGHVKNLGEDSTQIDKVRIYRTNARQWFHADDSDIVGLLCIARALEGGESDIVSTHHVFNCLRRERPDVLRTLCTPDWYFDRKGEFSRGQKEWIRCAVYYWYGGHLYSKWDPYFVKSLGRFSDKGLVPPLSPAQQEAIAVLEATCLREALHMVLEVGDIQFVTNNHMFHARTAYSDYDPPAPRRHLLRLWLSTPDTEGGWKLPFADSSYYKRGGIQVDDTPEKYPLDGE